MAETLDRAIDIIPRTRLIVETAIYKKKQQR